MDKRIKPRSLPGRILSVLCMCVFAIGTGLPAFAQETEIPELMEPVGVITDTAQAYIGKISDIAVYEGTVAPCVEAAAFSVSGIVDRVHVIVGQTVKKGDVLITLDHQSQQEKREALQRQIENARTDGDYEEMLFEIDRAILDLELEMLMTRTPDDADAIAMKKLDIEAFELEAELAREMRGFEIERLRKALAAVEEQMGQNVLTAPIDGTVMYIGDITAGSYVNAFAKIVYIADDERMRIETDYIMENTIRGKNRIYAHVGSNEYAIEYVPMDQKEMFAKVNAGETLISVFEIRDADEQISMGDFALVCLENEGAEDALLIPRNALYTETGGRYVYLMKNGARVRTDVEVGQMAEHVVEITAGLVEGDVVYVQE